MTNHFFRTLLVLIILSISGNATFGQTEPHERQFGIRSEFIVNNAFKSGLNTFVVDYKTYRHDVYAGISIPLIDNKNSYFPAMGVIIGYQHYTFPVRKHLNVYWYASLNFGRHKTSGEGGFFTADGSEATTKYTQTDMYLNPAVGIGTEIMAGKHFYANISLGFNLRTLFFDLDNEDSRMADSHTISYVIALEGRTGLGVRF